MLQHRSRGAQSSLLAALEQRISLAADSGDVMQFGGAHTRMDNNAQVAASSVGVVHVHTTELLALVVWALEWWCWCSALWLRW